MRILPLPEQFDQNEWYTLMGLIFTFIIIYALRKKYTMSTMILVCLFSIIAARISDHVLAGNPFDAYDLNDSKKFELFDLFSYFLYPPFALLFVYWYDKFRISGTVVLLYTLVFSLFSVLYEWITTLFRVFTFDHWTHLYSYAVYVLVQLMTLYYFQSVKKGSSAPLSAQL